MGDVRRSPDGRRITEIARDDLDESFFWEDHFVRQSVDFGATGCPWFRALTGTGASISYNTNADVTKPGTVLLSTGTTATGTAVAMQASADGTVRRSIKLGSSPTVYCDARLYIVDVPDGTNTFGLSYGLRSSNAWADRVSGGISYNAGAASWLLATAASSVTTTTYVTGASSLSITAGTWYDMRMKMTTSAVQLWAKLPSVKPWTFIGENTTNIPVEAMNPYFLINKTAGTTARVGLVDLYRLHYGVI